MAANRAARALKAGKFTDARKLNLARRHLDREQKRALIAQQLKATPQLSDRQIAESLGTSHPTVAAVRAELIESGDVEPLPTRTDSLGHQRPATQPERPSGYRLQDASAAGAQSILDSAKQIRQGRSAEIVARNERLRHAAAALPTPQGEYRTVVIDPPWPMEIIDRDVRPGQVGMRYPVMSLEEIEAIRLPLAVDATVYLWTTQRFPKGFRRDAWRA